MSRQMCAGLDGCSSMHQRSSGMNPRSGKKSCSCLECILHGYPALTQSSSSQSRIVSVSSRWSCRRVRRAPNEAMSCEKLRVTDIGPVERTWMRVVSAVQVRRRGCELQSLTSCLGPVVVCWVQSLKWSAVSLE
jgi:hypothetical protein